MIEAFKNIITNQNFLGAIFSVIFFIILGFILKRKQIINNENEKLISFLALNIAVPAMALKSFLCDFSLMEFKNDILVLLISLFVFILLLVIGNILFRHNENRKVYAIFMTIGQVSFFSIPIIEAIYKTNESLIAINMVAIVFRLFLYTYCYCVISKISFNKNSSKEIIKKISLNPIMIAMFIGIFIWLTQNLFVNMGLVVTDSNISYSILRFDISLPFLYKMLTYANNLTIPLCMILIGSTLGQTNIKTAITNRFGWLLAVLRTIIAPTIVLIIVYLIQLIPSVNLMEYQISALVIGFGAPLSAVVNTYCVKYDNNSYLASNTCFLATILSIMTLPLFYIAISIIF